MYSTRGEDLPAVDVASVVLEELNGFFNVLGYFVIAVIARVSFQEDAAPCGPRDLGLELRGVGIAVRSVVVG